MTRIAAFGDNVVDCYLADGLMYPGGNCVNVAVHARRAGAETAYVGAVANDAAGRVIRDALSAEEVDVSHLRMLDGMTAYCIIGHRGAERVFVDFDLGVSMFTPSAEDFVFLAGFDAVHVGQSSGLDASVPAVAAIAHLSYDFSTRREPAHLAAVAPFCFLASASAGDMGLDEAVAYSARIRDAGADWVLLTRGEAGALLRRGDIVVHGAAEPVAARDTLGAGDTFIARTLVGLLRNEAPEAILREAARAAAATCLYYGGLGRGAPLDLPVKLPEFARA